jgi:methylated-DNA-[protein]-cysteine S-methyltransferase
VWGSVPLEIAAAFNAYFDHGRCDLFAPLRLTPLGSAFQLLVWAELRKIPPGTTLSYRDLARAVGRANACRAVGSANGSNPLPIIIPCHRVVGTDGRLTGYGSGIDRKAWLLAHERAAAGAMDIGHAQLPFSFAHEGLSEC